MKTISYKTSEEYKSPLFLDVNFIIRLSQALDEIEEALKKQVELVNGTKTQDMYKVTFEKKITVGLSDKTIWLDSLNQILNKIEITEYPQNISIEYRVHDTWGKDGLRVRLHTYRGTFSDSINVLVDESDSSLAKECFEKISYIFKSQKPSKIFQIWSEFGGIAAMPFLFLCMLMIGAFSSRTEVPTELGKKTTEILTHGIDSTNSYEALAILLKVAAGEKLKDKLPAPIMENVAVIVALLFSIVLFIRPTRIIFEVKSGIVKIKLWKFYINLVTYAAPVFVFMFFLTKLFESLVG